VAAVQASLLRGIIVEPLFIKSSCKLISGIECSVSELYKSVDACSSGSSVEEVVMPLS
jgi:hypothetical protein